jgi:hypothetical protein
MFDDDDALFVDAEPLSERKVEVASGRGPTLQNTTNIRNEYDLLISISLAINSWQSPFSN